MNLPLFLVLCGAFICGTGFFGWITGRALHLYVEEKRTPPAKYSSKPIPFKMFLLFVLSAMSLVLYWGAFYLVFNHRPIHWIEVFGLLGVVVATSTVRIGLSRRWKQPIF